MFEAVAHGEFAVSWFHNGDLRRLLDPTASNASPCDRRRLSAKTSRRLRLLRDHGVIGKVPKTHRHSLTAHGELLAAVLFATRRANIKQLLDNAT